MGRPYGDRIMSNGIAPLGSLQGTEPVVPAGASGDVKASGTPFTAAETTIAQGALHPNPSFHIDAALGLVVMEFRDGPGGASSSIPTAQQLDAYRRAAGHAASQSVSGSAAHGTTGSGFDATGTTPATGTTGATGATATTATATPVTGAATQPSTVLSWAANAVSAAPTS